MKKVLSLALVLIIVLGLCACGGSGEGDNNEGGVYSNLLVGYARENITPEVPTGLGGYDNADKRVHEGLISYLYLTCIAFREGDETILVYTFDNCALSKDGITNLAKLVTEETGIPAEKQFYGATHTHSGPSYSSSIPGGNEAIKMRATALISASKKALEDLAPAKIYANCVEVEGMNFTRNYLTDEVTGEKTHVGESDKRLLLYKFDREEKKDVLMVNWAAHPDSSSSIGFYNVSADFPGALRDKVMKETGMEVAYFTAASGNQNRTSLILGEDSGLSMEDYGAKMGEYAIAALEGMKPIEGTGIKTTRVIYKANVDHSKDHMVQQAREVYELYQQTNLEASRPLAHEYGMQSAYEARAIISRASMGPTIDMDTRAFCIGGLGFVHGTYEMYSDSSFIIREGSPFEYTFIITSNNSYVASEAAFDTGEYEAVTGFYERGTCEAMAEHYVELLKSLK